MLPAILAIFFAASVVAAPHEIVDATEDPVAFVIWADGKATVTPGLPGRQDLDEALAIGDAIPPGRILTVYSGANLRLLHGQRTLAYLSGPGDYWISRQGVVVIDGPEAKLHELVGFDLGPQGARVRTAPGEPSPGGPLTLTVVAPRSTAIRDPRPDLRWQWAPTGGRFDLVIWRVDGDSRVEELERWTGLAARQHTPVAKLRRGRVYRWAVSLQGPSGATQAVRAESWFRVLTPAEEIELSERLDKLDRARRVLPGDHPELDVVRARLLEGYGLVDDARAAFLSLWKSHPERPALSVEAARLEARRQTPPPQETRLVLPFGLHVRL